MTAPNVAYSATAADGTQLGTSWPSPLTFAPPTLDLIVLALIGSTVEWVAASRLTAAGVTQVYTDTPNPAAPSSNWWPTAQVTFMAATAPTAPAPTTGTFTLNWKPPTANADGTSPVTALSGYTINQGVSTAKPPVQPATLPPVATVGPTVTTYTTAQLPAGTYFFTVEANAADGTESIASNVVTGTISPPEVPGAPSSVTITATV